MKYVCLVLLCLLCVACTKFENPIVGEKGPALDEALIGHWSAEKDDSRFEVVITRNGDEGKLEFKATEPGKQDQKGPAGGMPPSLVGAHFTCVPATQSKRNSNVSSIGNRRARPPSRTN